MNSTLRKYLTIGGIIALGVALVLSWQYFRSLQNLSEVNSNQFRVLNQQIPEVEVELQEDTLHITQQNLPPIRDLFRSIDLEGGEYQIVISEAAIRRGFSGMIPELMPIATLDSATREVTTPLPEEAEEHFTSGEELALTIPTNNPQKILFGEISEQLSATLTLPGADRYSDIKFTSRFFDSDSQTAQEANHALYVAEGTLQNVPSLEDTELKYTFKIMDNNLEDSLSDYRSQKQSGLFLGSQQSTLEFRERVDRDEFGNIAPDKIQQLNNFVIGITLEREEDIFIPIFAKRFRI